MTSPEGVPDEPGGSLAATHRPQRPGPERAMHLALLLGRVAAATECSRSPLDDELLLSLGTQPVGVWALAHGALA